MCLVCYLIASPHVRKWLIPVAAHAPPKGEASIWSRVEQSFSRSPVSSAVWRIVTLDPCFSSLTRIYLKQPAAALSLKRFLNSLRSVEEIHFTSSSGLHLKQCDCKSHTLAKRGVGQGDFLARGAILGFQTLILVRDGILEGIGKLHQQ